MFNYKFTHHCLNIEQELEIIKKKIIKDCIYMSIIDNFDIEKLVNKN